MKMILSQAVLEYLSTNHKLHNQLKLNTGVDWSPLSENDLCDLFNVEDNDTMIEVFHQICE